MKAMKSYSKYQIGVQIVAVILLSVSAVSQTKPSKLVAEIDLKPLGVTIPALEAISATAMELLFVSDTYLALLKENDRVGEPKDAHLMLYEIGKGGVRSQKELNLGEAVFPILSSGTRSEQVLQWVDSEHFAYRTLSGKVGRMLCDTNLDCRTDRQEINQIGPPHTGSCESNDLLGFIDTQRTLCFVNSGHTHRSARVMDSSGHQLYLLEQGVLPWDSKLVSSVQGQRFGLEWKSNTDLQLLNPLACMDECPPPGKQQFVIFNSRDGRKLQEFIWDPRPYNLYVRPTLSPSGKMTAFIRVNTLAVYSLN